MNSLGLRLKWSTNPEGALRGSQMRWNQGFSSPEVQFVYKKRRNTDSQVAQVGGMNNQKEICTNKLLKKMKETYKSTTDNFKGRPAFILTEPP